MARDIWFVLHFWHVVQVRKHTDMPELHASQKTHGHARIARVSGVILACPCVFWLAQRAKKCYKIWYLGPLPTSECWSSPKNIGKFSILFCCTVLGWILTSCFMLYLQFLGRIYQFLKNLVTGKAAGTKAFFFSFFCHIYSSSSWAIEPVCLYQLFTFLARQPFFCFLESTESRWLWC